MSVRARPSNRTSGTSVSLVLIMLLLGTTLTAWTPEVMGSANGDAAITDSTPTNNSFVSRYDSVQFSAEVENMKNTYSQERVINWFICEGVKNTNTCYNTRTSTGSIDVTAIAPQSNQTFVTGDYFSPNGYIGTYTVVYQFEQTDFNPNNDILVFYFNSTDQYIDIKIDLDYDITSGIDGLNEYQGSKILNSNKSYGFSLKGYSHTCTTCSADATIGWQLYNIASMELLKESYKSTGMLPTNSYYTPFIEEMPTFEHNNTGEFLLIYGIFNVISSPNDDMIDDNNIFQAIITINDEYDISITSLSPAHNSNSPNYLYGEDMLRASFKNNGNISVDSISPTAKVFDNTGVKIYESTCTIVNLRPNDNADCLFDLIISGSGLEIELTISEQYGILIDENNLDNSLTEISDIIIPTMNSYILYENQKEWYTNAEIINITAMSSPYALKPINYSWWYSGLINVGYEQTFSIDASLYGLGSHGFKVTSRDSYGNVENVYFNIEIRDQLIWSDYPFTEVSAITKDSSDVYHERSLPEIGETYNIGSEFSPLILLSYDLISSNNSVLNGDNWLEISINTYELLPSSVDLNTLVIRDLEHKNSTYWSYFTEENDVQNNFGNVTLKIFKPTTILISGKLSAPLVEALSFNVTQYQQGGFNISWLPQGELENEYFGGWNVYRKTVSSTGGNIFPTSFDEENALLWESLTRDNLIATVSPHSSNILDFDAGGADYCASFAIIPFDRSNKLYFEKANVSANGLGEAEFQCSDSEPPVALVTDFSHNWEFTNDTECYKIANDWSQCYELELSWIWPIIEETNLSWNLYRTEQNPNSLDLHLLEPIAYFNDVEYGAQQIFIQSGQDEDGIRPYRTYFYTLTPLDKVGNERSLVINSGNNTEEVYIRNDWWSYNQHLIPEPEPEPEPPLGSEWLGEFSDSLEHDEFRTAGMVTIAMLCFSVIMLAFIFKRMKRFRRVVKARKKQLLAEAAANEFDDFFN